MISKMNSYSEYIVLHAWAFDFNTRLKVKLLWPSWSLCAVLIWTV